MLSYFQAVVMGLLQGVSELFPISSLGHSVLLPTLFGWDNLVRAQSDTESFFLAFLVGLHVATALALIIFYRQEWGRIVVGFFTSIGKGKADTPDERLAWLLIVATIPGRTGRGHIRALAAHPFREAALRFALHGRERRGALVRGASEAPPGCGPN